MMKTKIFLYVAIFALAAAACNDDKDTTGPKITLLQPENEAAFARGGELLIEFRLDDPSGINAYKIDIHYAGEGHEHAHSQALSITPAHEDGEEEEHEEPWEFLEAYTDQKGKTSAHVEKTLTIPDDIHGGEYHLGILATDTEGNESQVYIDIDIEE
ncbi:MAG: DUF4625 domain-containing protein [Prevotellaceae bacterium]|jgi:hypothetical protein|nr:DUF4625 domain-containing protein [Prevotellaceae bacterium]